MPSVPIHPPSRRDAPKGESTLPRILRTPSGLAIVEIQGTIKFSTQSNGDTTAASIGRLTFPLFDETKAREDTAWQKRVHLYVGQHQRLTGEVKKLPHPIAVLRRKADADDGEHLEIAEIVYYKLLFAHRPEPVGATNSE